MVIIGKTLQGEAQLTQITDTLHLLRLLLGTRNSRKQERDENCDNGDGNQQFSQGEPTRSRNHAIDDPVIYGTLFHD